MVSHLTLTIVPVLGVSMFVSKHIEITMHTKDEDSMNLSVVDNSNLFFIIITGAAQRKPENSKEYYPQDYIFCLFVYNFYV